MANLNKVCLIGRLTRDPEARTFANGGKVVQFGFAVNNRKKNQQSGEWEDDPCFLDVKVFDREQGKKLASLCEEYLAKGALAYLEGHLVMEKWQDKNTNENRQKLVVVLDDVQFLQPKSDQQQGMRPQQNQPRGQQQQRRQPANDPSEVFNTTGGPGEGDIPF